MPPIFDDYGDENNNDSYFVEFAPTTIKKNDYVYVESINSFMHVAHDKNVLCDSYIVNFIHDATKSYYERGKHGFMNLNNIKPPLFMFKFLMWHLFCLPMLVLVASCFNDLFSYKIPMHRKWVRLNCVSYFILDALFCFNSYFLCEHFSQITEPILMAIKKQLLGDNPLYFLFSVYFCFFESWKLLPL
jgi:hypothetical protein